MQNQIFNYYFIYVSHESRKKNIWYLLMYIEKVEKLSTKIKVKRCEYFNQ